MLFIPNSILKIVYQNSWKLSHIHNCIQYIGFTFILSSHVASLLFLNNIHQMKAQSRTVKMFYFYLCCALFTSIVVYRESTNKVPQELKKVHDEK